MGFSSIRTVSACVTLAALLPITASAETTVLLPRHTLIPIVLPTEIRVGGMGSSEQKKVEFEVAQDIIVNGYVIAKQGDTVEGHFTTATNVTSRFLSQDVSQEVSLDVDDIINFCGDTIHMQFERTFVGGAHQNALNAMVGLGAHAHDVVFAKGTLLEARTDRVEKHICAERTSRQPLAMPAAMLVPNDEVTPTPAP